MLKKGWRAVNSLKYPPDTDEIMPQHAIAKLFDATRGKDVIVTTEVGQHRCGQHSSWGSMRRTAG